jgi:hypothetical protein
METRQAVKVLKTTKERVQLELSYAEFSKRLGLDERFRYESICGSGSNNKIFITFGCYKEDVFYE